MKTVLFMVFSFSVYLLKSYSQDANYFDPEAEHDGFSDEIINGTNLEVTIAAGERDLANLDKAGNWGTNTFGFQLSIRSTTNTFKFGDSIPVVVILRNVSTNQLSYFTMVHSEPLTGFKIEDESGHQRPTSVGPGGSFGQIEIAPKHQVRTDFDFAKPVPLAPGVYKAKVIQGGLGLMQPNMKQILARVESGVLIIKVVPK